MSNNLHFLNQNWLDMKNHSKEFEKLLKSEEDQAFLSFFKSFLKKKVKTTMGILNKKASTEEDFYRVNFIAVKCESKDSLEDCLEKLKITFLEYCSFYRPVAHLKNALCIEIPLKNGERHFYSFLAFDIPTFDETRKNMLSEFKKRKI